MRHNADHSSLHAQAEIKLLNVLLEGTYMILTEAFVESDQGHRQLVTFVDDRVVAMLGHPALGRAIHGGRVHQPMADVHGNDGAVMGLKGLYTQYID